jgi:sulfhydrogenase subunit beta (sulfur reductase)
MDTLYIDKKDWDSFLNGKSSVNRIFAPVDSNGSLFYEKIGPGDETKIVYNRARPVEPLKFFLFPFKERVHPSLKSIPAVVIMGPASCDVKALKILDSVFKNGEYKDPNYSKRRENALIVSFDCQSPYSTCFCELVGVHPYPEGGFDLNVYQSEEGLLIDIGSDKGRSFIGDDQRFFQATGEQIEKRAVNRRKVVEKIRESNRDFNLTSIENLKGAYQTELWKVSGDIERCIQCGSCTNNCPTCVCFLLEETGRQKIMRKTRMWDSCLFPGYARMAAGASPRPTLYDRYANRLLCKYWYMEENFGLNGCTGCGRCIAGCPGKIDKRKVITEVLREKSRV